tara:strand:+ start:111 stop:401 length:291 start_codon:yes stop_codon:yes gene_type:complete
MNIWLIVSIFEFLLILFLIKKLYDIGIKTIQLEDETDNAITVIEDKYKKMSEILNRPVFFDSVEVRQVVNDIYECQVALYKIAIAIGNAEAEEEEE